MTRHAASSEALQREIARCLSDCVSQAMGPALAGIVLHGSAVLGDFASGRSDIDLLVITEASPTPPQRDALVACMAAIGADTRVRFDLRVVTRETAARPERLPQMELYVGFRPARSPGVVVEDGPVVESDLVVEFSVCRTHGRALVGPPPAELLGDVPIEWMVEVGDDVLAMWQDLEFEEEHADLMVFTACRLWLLSEEGVYASKAAAAEWALRRDPSLVAVAASLQQRSSGDGPKPDEAAVMALLHMVREAFTGRAGSAYDAVRLLVARPSRMRNICLRSLSVVVSTANT